MTLDGGKAGNTVLRMPTLTFKVSEEEARVLRAKARAENTTLSAFLRSRVLEVASPRQRLTVRRHPVSGLPYDAGGRGRDVVTRDTIKALLADFP